MMNEFKFCPMCGTEKVQYLAGKKWFCPECGFTLYNNVAAACGVIISDSQGNILLEKRGKDPKKGLLDIPGGFCDYDESAEEAAIRECKEEMNLDLNEIQFLCTAPNDYEYKKIAYKTCDVFYTAPLPEGNATIDELICKLQRQESEVQGFVSCKVTCKEDIENLPLAFKSAKKALTVWLSVRKIN